MTIEDRHRRTIGWCTVVLLSSREQNSIRAEGLNAHLSTIQRAFNLFELDSDSAGDFLRGFHSAQCIAYLSTTQTP
jgi:hypothetical protein